MYEIKFINKLLYQKLVIGVLEHNSYHLQVY